MDGLEKKRLVSRQKGEDARNNYICLTDYGRSMRDQSVEIGHALLERVQTGLDESELAAARRVPVSYTHLFLLLSAGCAIGLGNVWRFPYITGQYGGALFVLVYLFFLLVMGLPILTMEFSVGRASRRNMGDALRQLEPKGRCV